MCVPMYIQLWSCIGYVSQCLQAQFSGGHLACPQGVSKCSIAQPSAAPAVRADMDLLIVPSCR